MQIKYLVPTILGLFIKLMICVLVFFLVLNIFAFMYNFPKITAISYLVQDSVRKHGYLPYEDYKSIQAIIDAYQYQAKNSGSPLNVNKIVTNLKIVVYDLEGNGKPNPQATNFHSWDYNEEDLHFIDVNNTETVKSRKKQQSTVLLAGIYCDYAILHPLNGWILVDIATGQEDADKLSNQVSFTGQSAASPQNYAGQVIDWNTNQSLDYSGGRKNGYTTFNTFTVSNANDSSNVTGALFIEPVISDTFYADIDDSSATNLIY